MYVIKKKEFCWHKFKYYESKSVHLKTLPNGNRLFETHNWDKCVKCGLIRKSWIKGREWFWAGDKTHDEYMASHNELMEIIKGIEGLKLEVKK